jgi:hypothetical protein
MLKIIKRKETSQIAVVRGSKRSKRGLISTIEDGKKQTFQEQKEGISERQS